MSAGIEERHVELRERILDATLRVIRERGMAHTRTSAIAEEAGCAEGTIYRYFDSKPALVREAIRCRLPEGIVPLDLSRRAGTRTVQEHLIDVAQAALSFYDELVPLAAAALADADLWAERAACADRGSDSLAAYLRAEQKLGRLRTGVDPGLVARLLLDACLGASFLAALADGQRDALANGAYARTLVATLMPELEP